MIDTTDDVVEVAEVAEVSEVAEVEAVAEVAEVEKVTARVGDSTRPHAPETPRGPVPSRHLPARS